MQALTKDPKDADKDKEQGIKRGLNGTNLTLVKRPRVEAEQVDAETITGQKLLDVPLLSIRGGSPVILRIMVQNKIAMLNTTNLDVTWPAGTLLCAFGKGVYTSKGKLEDVEIEKEILFKLDDDETVVIFNNSLTTLGQTCLATPPTGKDSASRLTVAQPC